MTKGEILNALNTSGEVNTFRKSANWERAFKLYNEIHNTHRNMNCGSCFRDVLSWLKMTAN